MQTKKLQIIRPALARASSQPRCSLALAALLLLLGQGAAPARATATIINTAVTAPVTVNSGDELDIIAGGSVTVGLAAALTINAGGTVSISGGSVSGLIGVQMLGGTLKISSGSVHGDATGIFGGTVMISGGSVSSYGEALFISGAGSSLQLSGGSVTMGIVKVLSGATATISGGSVSAELIAYGGGTVTVAGCNLLLSNPQPGAGGGTQYTLTGTLLDGTAINTTAQVFPPSQVSLADQCGQRAGQPWRIVPEGTVFDTTGTSLSGDVDGLIVSFDAFNNTSQATFGFTPVSVVPVDPHSPLVGGSQKPPLYTNQVEGVPPSEGFSVDWEFPISGSSGPGSLRTFPPTGTPLPLRVTVGGFSRIIVFAWP
jgi:hypothetical protein